MNMSNRPAMSVTPVFQETATGEQIVDFNVDTGDSRQAAIQHFNETQDSLYHQDDRGAVAHEYEFVTPEEAQSIEPDYEEQLTSEDFEPNPEMEDSFYKQTMDYVGGDAAYQEMVEYAAANWDTEDIDIFDTVMSSDDYEKRALVVQFLKAKFEAHNQ